MNDVKVGCETTDGLLNVHSASETCEVCSDPNVQGEVPKPKRTRRSKKSDEPQPFWNADRIKEICLNTEGTTTLENGKACPNSYIVYRFLQAMYKFQTADEQSSGFTKNQNNVGFSGTDSAFLSDVAVKSQQYGRLTPNQARAVGRCLKKYAATQLVHIAQDAAAAVATEKATPAAGYNTVETETARQQQTQSRPVQTTLPMQQSAPDMQQMLAAKKADDPTHYYDPFDDGEKLDEEAAARFWTKRFSMHPYKGKGN